MNALQMFRQLYGAFAASFTQILSIASNSVVTCMLAAIFLLANMPAAIAATVVRVEGSGSENNTQEIQQAFDAAIAAGPGSVVILAGPLFTNEIDATGFEGTVLGDPRNPPVIDVLRGLDPSLPGVAVTTFGDLSESNALFKFRDSSLRMVGPITFNITAFMPAEDHVLPNVGGLVSNELTTVIRLSGETRARIRNVTILGGDGNFAFSGASANVLEGIRVADGLPPFNEPMLGRATIVDSAISDTPFGIVAAGLSDGSRLLIARNRLRDNFFFGIIGQDNSGTFVNIHDNVVRGTGLIGIGFAQFNEAGMPGIPISAPVSGMISGNSVETIAGALAGIELLDASLLDFGVKALDLAVKNNEVLGEGVSAIASFGATGVRMTGNYVTGSWILGINPFLQSNDCLVSDNRLGMARDGQVLGITTVVGAVAITAADNCKVGANKFFAVTGPALGIGDVLPDSDSNFNIVRQNDYRQSGLTECAIVLRGDNNLVVESKFPEGTSPAAQVCDFGNDNVVRVH